KPLLTRAPLLTRSNVGILVICVLIGCANQYYAVFTVLLLGLVLAAQACQRLGLARLGSTVVAAVVIAVTLGLNMAPSVLYQRNHGTNTAIEHRNVEDSEKYGLKLTSMLLPREGHRVDLFGRATHKYGEHSPVDSEQGQSLGLIGAAGLTLLLALVVLGPFRRRRDVKDPLEDRLRQLGALVIGIFLLATIGGLSSLIALFVPQIRGWNRISVFLAFFVFFALALLLDEVRARQVLPRAVMRVWPVVLALVVTIGILDSTFDPPPYAPTKAEFASDDVFVHRIERRLGKTAMVFQLPYNPYPESPGLVDQAYYDEARGYLHSSTLRWSYGAVRGRPQGDWQEPLVLGPVRDLLDTVAALGFTGIYVDRFGYGDHGAEIEHQLSALAPGSRLISPNHRLVLYDIRSYAKALKTSEPERVAKLRRSILRLGTS
ncbi:MAG: hypothetical protein QOF21_1016, partial [Actinomycetota bacterium]